MNERRKVLNVYGDRGWSDGNKEYNLPSIMRGYGGLSSYLEELQLANKGLTVHSVSYSIIDKIENAGFNKRIVMTVLYSGEINNIVNGKIGRYGVSESQDGQDDVNEYTHNGYNKLICVEL